MTERLLASFFLGFQRSQNFLLFTAIVYTQISYFRSRMELELREDLNGWIVSLVVILQVLQVIL